MSFNRERVGGNVHSFLHRDGIGTYYKVFENLFFDGHDELALQSEIVYSDGLFSRDVFVVTLHRIIVFGKVGYPYGKDRACEDGLRRRRNGTRPNGVTGIRNV